MRHDVTGIRDRAGVTRATPARERGDHELPDEERVLLRLRVYPPDFAPLPPAPLPGSRTAGWSDGRGTAAHVLGVPVPS